MTQQEKTIDSLIRPAILALDLDLTLHDVIVHYNIAINNTLLHFGYPALATGVLEKIGNNFTNTQAMLEEFLPEQLIDKAFEYYITNFISLEIPRESLLPGAKELLYLVRHELKLPIIGVTNSEEYLAKKILRDLDILHLFNHVIGVTEQHFPKPDTQMLLKALHSVSATAGPEVWLVGDQSTDTKCAKDANCTAIRFYHYEQPKDENADLYINCHYNLYAILKEKCGKNV